jgi:predicted RNase H-like HicB family nuclease
MVYTYRVEFETDPETKHIVVSLPTLNYTADFGSTVEEALTRLHHLAQGFLEVLIEKGEPIPPSDPPGEGVYLSLKLEPEPLPA